MSNKPARSCLLLACCAALATQAGAAPPPPRANTPVVERSIADLQADLAAGRTTSRRLVQAYLARIAAYDRKGPRLNAILRLAPDALAEADALDRERRAHGPRGPLHGIPVLVKDNFDTADMPTSGGTLALATRRPTADAVQVARLRAAGAIALGKTTMHELAAGMTTVSSLTGFTRNPYDPARSPGGSSGGTGAAVAASLAAAGMGTDTCGSVRIPAAYQALFALRETPGLASMAGIMPLSPTQDVAGPLARTTADLALMLEATADAPGGYRAALDPAGLAGERIGILRALVGDQPEDAEGRAVLESATGRMRDAGAQLVDVEVPGLADLLRDSSVIAFEFKDELAAYLAEPPAAPVRSLGAIIAQGLYQQELETRLRQREATRPDPVALQAVLARRARLKSAVLAAMAAAHVDALLYPTTLRRPPLIEGDDSGVVPNCQLSASTGLPALAMPAGFSPRGLPVGVELLGRPFAERTLLRLASGWEAAGAAPRRPPFSTPELRHGSAPRPSRTIVRAAAGAATARVHVTYDPGTARLGLRARIGGTAAAAVVALTLARAAPDGRPGPVIATIVLPGRDAGATALALAQPDRAALATGRLRMRLFTATLPLGGSEVALSSLATR